MIRYQIHFDSPTIKCPFVENNPGYFPVVEMGGIWGFGRVVCLCDNEDDAKRIVNLLNAHGLSHQPRATRTAVRPDLK